MKAAPSGQTLEYFIEHNQNLVAETCSQSFIRRYIFPLCGPSGQARVVSHDCYCVVWRPR